MAAVAIRGMDNNIYTQIGIVLIIALASKNAILIVEFARELRAQGRGILEAAVEAVAAAVPADPDDLVRVHPGHRPAGQRQGAGAASRRALGTAVFGGMIAATVLAVFFVPVFYVVVQRFAELRRDTPAEAPSPSKIATEPPEHTTQ